MIPATGPFLSSAEQTDALLLEIAYGKGAEAAQVGLPASANPYPEPKRPGAIAARRQAWANGHASIRGRVESHPRPAATVYEWRRGRLQYRVRSYGTAFTPWVECAMGDNPRPEDWQELSLAGSIEALVAKLTRPEVPDCYPWAETERVAP